MVWGLVVKWWALDLWVMSSRQLQTCQPFLLARLGHGFRMLGKCI